MIFSIADSFIKRPVLTTVCTLLILLVGGIAIPLLPIEQLPQLAPTQINVNASYAGADAETVETTVTSIIEQELNGLEGMSYMSSNSSSGSSSIQVIFGAGRDKDIAQVDVQNKVAAAEPLLPAPVRQTGLRVNASSSAILLVYSFSSENGEYDDQFLTNYVDLFVTDAIKRVPGVGDVTLYGAGKYAMRVWLDPSALAGVGLTALDVTNAISEQNIQVGVGAIGSQPAPPAQPYEFTVRVQGRLAVAEEFADIVLKVGDGGELVRLRDVGRVELGAQTYAARVTANERVAVGLGISQLPGSNALDVSTAVRQTVADLEQSFPPGLTAAIVFDTSDFVKVSLWEVVVTLAQAIALVILILYLFLQDWRTTVIPAIAIPVALIGAMAFLLIAGFSINTLTLFGCILASGLVVDDAIVIVEAIAAKMQAGQRPRRAALESMDELAGAVVSTSLVLMAVFIPVAFFPGTTGKIYQQFALTIAFTVLVSTFNALTFSPSMAAILLKPQQDRAGGLLGGLFAGFNQGLAGAIATYRDWVSGLVRWRWVVMAGFAGALVLTAWMYQVVPTGFVPEEDQGYFLGLVQAPDGVSLDYTDAAMAEAEAIILANPNVSNTFMVRGAGFDGSGSNRGLFFATLKPWDERPRRDQSIGAVLADLNRQFQGIQAARVAAFNAPAVSGLSTFSGFEFQLQDRSGGQLSMADFLGNAGEIIGAANQDPALGGSVYTQFTANAPQLRIDVNRDRLKALNVSFSDALNTLSVYLGSRYVNDFTLGQRSYRVYVQADQDYRARPEQMGQYYVRARDGAMVALSEVVTVTPISGPATISHFNLFRSIKLQGQAAPGYSSGQALQAMESAYAQAALPVVGREWTGTAREEITAGGQAVIIFGLGIVIVFLVLAAQYESYIDPLIILLSVPLAMLGALVFLFARRLDLDVYAQVGLVMLIGLASKNSILIVEFANQSRAEGMKIAAAAVYAAEQRFRPILMTAISSLVGFFPLVIASGAGAASRRSIGTVVFGGLFVATFLSLLVVPVLYTVVKTLAEQVFGSRSPEDREPLEPPPPPPPEQLPSHDDDGGQFTEVPLRPEPSPDEPTPTPNALPRWVEGESLS